MQVYINGSASWLAATIHRQENMNVADTWRDFGWNYPDLDSFQPCWPWGRDMRQQKTGCTINHPKIEDLLDSGTCSSDWDHFLGSLNVKQCKFRLRWVNLKQIVPAESGREQGQSIKIPLYMEWLCLAGSLLTAHTLSMFGSFIIGKRCAVTVE